MPMTPPVTPPMTPPDSPPNRRGKPPHRSWRSLPPSPPLAAPGPHPDQARAVTAPATSPAASQPTAAEPAPTAEGGNGRRRAWVAVALTVALLALGAGVVLAFRDGHASPDGAGTTTTPATTAPATTAPAVTGPPSTPQDVLERILDEVLRGRLPFETPSTPGA